MLNHNLFIYGVNGAAEPATAEQILAAARQVLAHRVRRGATLTSPQKVREYLSMRLGHLDYEVFGLIPVDSHHRVIDYVELFCGTIDGQRAPARSGEDGSGQAGGGVPAGS
jgi:DNA repair protein RadC